jgi:hypothetical protein
MTREEVLQLHFAARVYQARYDSAFESWGMRAKNSVLGESVKDYRRTLAVQAKKLLPDDHQFRKVQYRSLKANAFEALEPSLPR